MNVGYEACGSCVKWCTKEVHLWHQELIGAI
jgi:hypothetical protein